MAAPIKDF